MEQKRKYPSEIAKSSLATAQVGVANVDGATPGSARSSAIAVGGPVKPPGKDDTAPAAFGDRGRASGLCDQI
jgi:hypothetical protein